ncbi:MAG: hypothetical protein JST17_11805 [Bacteroidetes bacterium]|nr:hypothetical protein [Bacteroidota bacterium]MBS1930093.1 hypothetical protein [Bacteroidota bacterium]
MKRTIIFISICFFIGLNGYCQKHKLNHYSIAFSTLHTDFPFGSFSNLFTKEFHPGFEVGTGFNWKSKAKHDWFQGFQFGYSYQRFVQHSISLYSKFGYRYKFLKTVNLEASVGAGYLHAIPAVSVFKLQNDGTYKKKTNLGRPQAMASFSIGLSKKITVSGTSLFLDYQQQLQFPFIKSYVPLLPSNILIIGVKVPFKSK